MSTNSDLQWLLRTIFAESSQGQLSVTADIRSPISNVCTQSFAVARPTIINNSNWPTNDSPGKALSGVSLANWNYGGGSVYASTRKTPHLSKSVSFSAGFVCVARYPPFARGECLQTATPSSRHASKRLRDTARHINTKARELEWRRNFAKNRRALNRNRGLELSHCTIPGAIDG